MFLNTVISNPTRQSFVLMSRTPSPNNLNLVLRFLSQHFHHRRPPLELLKLKQIHSLLTVSGFSDHSPFLTRVLLHCLSLPPLSFPRAYAFSIFTRIRNPNVFTYNALIRAFSFHPRNAVFFYARMRREGVFPNEHTFPLLLKSKTQMPFQIFSQSIKFGFESDHYLRNSLLSLLANCGLLKDARHLFDEMPHRDCVAYTTLMDGYVRNSRASQALDLFLEMRLREVSVDGVAVVSVLCAVGMLGRVWLGKWVHGFYVVTGRVAPDVYLGSALVDMYSKCGFCEDAHRVFREIPVNLVSWGALLSGYVQCQKFKHALSLFFQEMLFENIELNEAILASVLTACAHLGSLEQGKWVDDYLTTRKFELNSVLGTALIDMYAKCGCIEEAVLVFSERMRVKGVYPFTALIFGLAMNGDSKGSLNLFSQMVSSGVRPNEVTFIAVLSACSHGGLLNEGRSIFESMECVYGIKPKVDHYGCMVDLLGRAGRLLEAVELIESMPMEPSAGVWGALLGGCVIHRDFELGKSVGNYLIELEPYRDGRYRLLANLHSECREWAEAGRVRRKMNEVVGVGKSRGCSWIELNGEVREFVASGVEAESVCGVVDSLVAHMKLFPFGLEEELAADPNAFSS